MNEILVYELAHPHGGGFRCIRYGIREAVLVQARHESFDLIAVWPIWNVRHDLEAVATDAAEGGAFSH